MKVTSSALQLRLEQLTTLTAEERSALSELERTSRSLRKREIFLKRDELRDGFAILRSGWATRRVVGHDGRTAITHIFGPGDLIGFCDLGTKSTPHDVVMQTDGSVSLFGSKELGVLSAKHPRLLSVFIAVSQVEDVVLRDRFFAATRLSAEDRLMHFFLCMKSKVPHQNEGTSERFPMPLSQKEIGDALGLTDIYVNRLLRALTDRDEISIERPYVRVMDPSKWVTQTGFQDRYAATNIEWLD